MYVPYVYFVYIIIQETEQKKTANLCVAYRDLWFLKTWKIKNLEDLPAYRAVPCILMQCVSLMWYQIHKFKEKIENILKLNFQVK